MLHERPWFKSWPEYLPREIPREEKPLYALLSRAAEKYGQSTCLLYEGRGLTFREVDELSSRFASALQSKGLRQGDRAAIFLPNTPQFVISYFGILKAGGIVVPCSPLYKERELEHQLRDSGASIIVATNDIVRGNDLFAPLEACRGRLALNCVIAASVTDYLPSVKRSLAGFAGVKNVARRGTLPFRKLVETSAPIREPVEVNPTEDIAVLQYTGGTTGTSKGAMLTHFNLCSNALMTAQALPITHDDVALTVLPLFHIYGMTAAMNAPLSGGARMVLLPRFDVKTVMETIQKEGVTCFCGVPTMYIAIINHPDVSRFDLQSVRACISGGAALPVVVRRKFMEVTGGSLVEGYGLTECSPVTHCNPLRGGTIKDGSIGIPFPGTDAVILDTDDPSKILGPGEVGELAIKGPQVMKGYWNKPEETLGVMKNGWLLTGDIARMDEDGCFFIVDRKKDMIDVGGFKVYPREVEEVLFEHPAVKEAAVIGVPDEYRGEAVKAFVILKEKQRASEGDLIEFCKQKLAKYKAPAKVEFVNDLPKTLVGKVLRRKLRENEPIVQQ